MDGRGHEARPGWDLKVGCLLSEAYPGRIQLDNPKSGAYPRAVEFTTLYISMGYYRKSKYPRFSGEERYIEIFSPSFLPAGGEKSLEGVSFLIYWIFGYVYV